MLRELYARERENKCFSALEEGDACVIDARTECKREKRVCVCVCVGGVYGVCNWRRRMHA